MRSFGDGSPKRKKGELRSSSIVVCGQRSDARQLLTEIDGWFPKGFDTAELQGTKALLTELP
jgi:hypothetical protein